MYKDVLKIFLLYRLTRSAVNIGCSYVIVVYMSSVERNLSLYSPSHVILQWNIVVQIVPFPELFYTYSMKSIKTPNHPAYHWITLWPLEVWVRGLYNSWWFCVHKQSMFIYLSMGKGQFAPPPVVVLHNSKSIGLRLLKFSYFS